MSSIQAIPTPIAVVCRISGNTSFAMYWRRLVCFDCMSSQSLSWCDVTKNKPVTTDRLSVLQWNVFHKGLHSAVVED